MQTKNLFLEAVGTGTVQEPKNRGITGDSSQCCDREMMSILRVHLEENRPQKALVRSHDGDRYPSRSADSSDTGVPPPKQVSLSPGGHRTEKQPTGRGPEGCDV